MARCDDAGHSGSFPVGPGAWGISNAHPHSEASMPADTVSYTNHGMMAEHRVHDKRDKGMESHPPQAEMGLPMSPGPSTKTVF